MANIKLKFTVKTPIWLKLVAWIWVQFLRFAHWCCPSCYDWDQEIDRLAQWYVSHMIFEAQD